MGVPIQAILFDFGNVICAFDNRRMLANLSRVSGLDAEELERLILGSDLPRAYESGEMDSAAFLEALSEHCGVPFEEGAFTRAFNDIFTPIPETSDLTRNLRGRYRLGLISNTNPCHFEHTIRRTAVFPLFESVTLSHEVGTMKPDPRMFRDALARLDLPPEACVFIDDVPAYAQAASDLGLRGIQYRNPGQLLADLAGLGIGV